MSCRALRTTGFMVIAFCCATAPAHPQAESQPRPATIRVHLPLASAQLMVDDMPTRQTGADRVFVSPALEPGTNHMYTIKTVWQPNNYTTITRARKVAVKAGQEVEVDLREADDKQPDKIVIRNVPTPAEGVEEMLKLAEVGTDDVVYELGCGDGRIFVTAVGKFGAKPG